MGMALDHCPLEQQTLMNKFCLFPKAKSLYPKDRSISNSRYPTMGMALGHCLSEEQTQSTLIQREHTLTLMNSLKLRLMAYFHFQINGLASIQSPKAR